jgi:hypothetical protein
MDRRSFLRNLLGAAPVIAVAPKYFFAPIGGWKSDVIVNPGEAIFYLAPDQWGLADVDALTLESLRVNVVFENFFVNTKFWDKLKEPRYAASRPTRSRVISPRG